MAAFRNRGGPLQVYHRRVWYGSSRSQGHDSSEPCRSSKAREKGVRGQAVSGVHVGRRCVLHAVQLLQQRIVIVHELLICAGKCRSSGVSSRHSSKVSWWPAKVISAAKTHSCVLCRPRCCRPTSTESKLRTVVAWCRREFGCSCPWKGLNLWGPVSVGCDSSG